jgi:hypothetical protein
MIGLRSRVPSRSVILAIGILVVAACSGGPDDGAAAQPVDDVEIADGSDGSDPSGDVEAADDEPIEEAATVAAVDERTPAIDLDLPAIELETPVSGEGPRPELRWSPVDDASSYLVVLRADVDGAASWAWRGTATSVPVGPVEQPGLGAPEVREGMTWSVLAFDADDEPVAQSLERPIAP